MTIKFMLNIKLILNVAIQVRDNNNEIFLITPFLKD